MESVRGLLKRYKDSPRVSAAGELDDDLKYEPANAPQLEDAETCDHCERLFYAPPPKRRVVLWMFTSFLLSVLFTSLAQLYLSSRQPISKHLIDLFPIVPTEFQLDQRFVDDDPFDSPFWSATHPGHLDEDFQTQNKSDRMSVNAWNYYGSTYIHVRKDSPYYVDGGEPLIPLYEDQDNEWMKDERMYVSAFGHEMHCIGVMKHVFMEYEKGHTVDLELASHANAHCMEVIRQAVMCQPDLQLNYRRNGGFWGGAKHQCRDQKMVHDFLAAQNLGFHEDVGGVQKVFRWPMTHRQ